jgi:hypothetical protein
MSGSVVVFKSHNVVLAQVAARLDFDDFERDTAGKAKKLLKKTGTQKRAKSCAISTAQKDGGNWAHFFMCADTGFYLFSKPNKYWP